MSTQLIPPWIIPQEEGYDYPDDGTLAHRSQFAPGLAQRQSYGDPRLKMSRRHTVRGEEMGVLASVLKGAKGAYETVYSRVHRARRGSFATAELLLNPYFANGTTDWTSSNANLVLSVNDRTLRGTRAGVAADYTIRAGSFTTVSGAAYVARLIAQSGKGAMDYRLQLGTSAGGAELAATSGDLTSAGMRTLSALASGTTTHFSILDGNTGRSIGDFQEFMYVSVSRCILVNGGSQTGNALSVDALPVSTDGLLLKDDPFEINGELKFCATALNSDSSGAGYLQFYPALVRSPSDNDPIIVHMPMGKFIATNYSEVGRYGLQLDVTYELEHIYE